MKNDDLHKKIGIFNTQNLGSLHSTYKSTYLYPYARYMLSFVKRLMSFIYPSYGDQFLSRLISSPPRLFVDVLIISTCVEP